MNNTNNYSARDAYDIARQLLFNAMKDDPKFKTYTDPVAAAWNWVNSRKMSQHETRLEVELNATNNVYRFGLTQNQPNTQNVVFPTENRLTMQDTHIVNEYGITIGLAASTQDANWQRNTYPNTQIFAAGDVALLNNIFYSQGFFSIMVNNDQVIVYRPLWNHLYRGQTQQTAALGAGSPQDEVRGAEDSLITQEPNILLIGSKGYIPQITMPTALTGLAGTHIRAVISFLGPLAQNSTSVS